jgi:hypothetical protein
MSELRRHLEDYLRLRRALGFKLEFPGLVLPSLVSYLEMAGAATITAELAIAWAGLPRGVLPINWAHRLGAARGFARYLQTIDPATEIPPAGVWPSVTPARSPGSGPRATSAACSPPARRCARRCGPRPTRPSSGCSQPPACAWAKPSA